MDAPAATRLLIARHGETVDNAAERWQGWQDSPLTPRGIAQAEALGRRLAAEPLVAAYSSDLGRAVATARLALSGHRLELQQTVALRERDVGAFSGLSGREVQQRYAEALARRHSDHILDWAPPRGESFRQMLSRILPFVDQIGAEWPGGSVLLVTHGGVIRLLAAYALGRDWAHIYERHPSNGGLSACRWSDGSLTLLLFDETAFMDGASVPPLSER
ncbi:MAG TPA: histidine phosphatase family protein [Chloroflexota bacterium]|nr:histidine phosphatase family protein [Chloroflexota bacterium]